MALSYHFGASTATAQSSQIVGGSVGWSGIGNGVRASGVIGRVFYEMLDNGAARVFSPPIPGTQPILDTNAMGGTVLLGDGEVLEYSGTGWAVMGSIFTGPVPALHESWGQVKARYRGNPVSTRPGTTER